MTSKENVLEKVGSVSVEPVVKDKIDVTYFDLKPREKGWYEGKEIEAALPEKHLFSIAEVYGLIAALIAGQAEGEEGILKNTGDYNLFYTEKFCVSVSWYSVHGYCHVRSWSRGEDWDGGVRVFSPGLES